MAGLKTYLWRIFIALTQLLNTLFSGWPDESTSSRLYRLEQQNHPAGLLLRPMVDRLFFWQPHHCRSAYESERNRYQLPPILR